MDPRSGVKDYVRLSVFLERHPGRSGGSFVVWRRLRCLFRRGYSRIAAFPSRGRCPAGADRAQAVRKTDEESGEVRGTCGGAGVPDREWQRFNPCFLKNHSRPFLWKGQTSEARRGWLPRMCEYRFTRPTSAPSGHLLPKEGGRKSGAFVLPTKAAERR